MKELDEWVQIIEDGIRENECWDEADIWALLGKTGLTEALVRLKVLEEWWEADQEKQSTKPKRRTQAKYDDTDEVFKGKDGEAFYDDLMKRFGIDHPEQLDKILRESALSFKARGEPRTILGLKKWTIYFVSNKLGREIDKHLS